MCEECRKTLEALDDKMRNNIEEVAAKLLTMLKENMPALSDHEPGDDSAVIMGAQLIGFLATNLPNAEPVTRSLVHSSCAAVQNGIFLGHAFKHGKTFN